MATYNVNYGNRNLREVAATIAKSEADLVCLQETTRRSELYLRRALRRSYRHIAFRRAAGAGGLGLLSKSPIRHVKYIPRKFGYFGAWVVKVKLAGAEAQVAGVHLSPTDLRKARGLPDVMRRLLSAEAVRLSEMRHIHANLAPNTPTIVLGDINTLSSCSAPRFLLARGFLDSFASVTKDADAHPTWRWSARGVEWRCRIDYIFHTGELETSASKIVPSASSDHDLVVSTLSWTAKKAAAKADAPVAAKAEPGRPAETPEKTSRKPR